MKARVEERADFLDDSELSSEGSSAEGTSEGEGRKSARLAALTASVLCLAAALTAALICVCHGGQLWPGASRGRGAVLHFQFLAIADVPHSQLWRSFFDGAPPGSWTLWLHCKDRAACSRGDFMRRLPEARLVPSVPTVYCRDLVTAQVQLLRYALRSTSPARGVEKFVLVSDSTLPIKPFSRVLAALVEHEGSDFCLYPTSEWLRAELPGGRTAYMVQHSQFEQLSRRDAAALVRSWEASAGGLSVNAVDLNLTDDGESYYTAEYPAWRVPVSASSRRQQDLGIADFHNGRRHWAFCTDEVAAFSSIFGAVVFGSSNVSSVEGFGPLRLLDCSKDEACDQYGDCAGQVQGRCFTYFSFYYWSPDDRALERELAAEEGSAVRLPTRKDATHPVSFGNLSRKALRRLRESPWLFARKFAADARLPGFEEEVLGEGADGGGADAEECEEAQAGGGSGSGAAAAMAAEAVVHFMFLAIDGVDHAELWAEFFAPAPRGAWRAWLHCKDREACLQSEIYRRVPGMELVQTVRTLYCSDLVSGTVQMLRAALAAGAPAGAPEKFVLLSDSTLPAKPFSAVHAALAGEAASDFCIYPRREWLRADLEGGSLFVLQHHQWMVLNRGDARRLVCRWRPRFDAYDWPDWDVPLRGRGRAIAGRSRLPISRFGDAPSTPWACPDELAPFALLYGAFAPGADGAQRYEGFGTVTSREPAASGNQGRCRTLVLWNTSSPEAVKRQMIEDPGTELVEPTWGHGGGDPAVFAAFSAASLQALRASSYLFIRKIQPNASMAGYGRFMFSS